jgi:hypothetical protein
MLNLKKGNYISISMFLIMLLLTTSSLNCSKNRKININKVYVQLQNADPADFNIRVSSSQLPINRWVFGVTKRGFEINNLPQGEYCFAVSPSNYESYAIEFFAAQKTYVSKEEQVVKIALPKTSVLLKINSSQFDLKRLFKNKIMKDFSIIGKLEKYEDGKLTPYCQWLYLSPEKMLKESIETNVGFVAPGNYQITFFINYKKARGDDALDGYILGTKKFSVTTEAIKKNAVIDIEDLTTYSK